MVPPVRGSGTPRRAHAVTPFPPTVARGASAERIYAQIRTRLSAAAEQPMESTFDLPSGERATARTTLSLTNTEPPQVRATVVITVSESVDRRQRADYQGQVQQRTAGMVRAALSGRDLAPGYLSAVDVRWVTRR